MQFNPREISNWVLMQAYWQRLSTFSMLLRYAGSTRQVAHAQDNSQAVASQWLLHRTSWLSRVQSPLCC